MSRVVLLVLLLLTLVSCTPQAVEQESTPTPKVLDPRVEKFCETALILAQEHFERYGSNIYGLGSANFSGVITKCLDLLSR